MAQTRMLEIGLETKVISALKSLTIGCNCDIIVKGKNSHSVNPSAIQKERSYPEIQTMKSSMFFTFVLAILANVTHAQEAVAATHPPFVPPVREAVETNQPPSVNLLKAVQNAYPDLWKVDTNSAPMKPQAVPRTDVYDRLGMTWPVSTNTGVISLSSQGEKEKKQKAEMAARLIAQNEKVQAERRVVTNSVAVANRPATITNRVVVVTNLAAKVVQPKKAGKNAAPPSFVAPDSVTNYVPAPKDNQVFTYEQEVLVPRTEAEAVNRDHAIARLEGREQGIWSYRGPAQSASNTGTEYRVDQRPLDQGTQPAPAVEYYPAYQQSYAGTYPATYAVPTYESYGVVYPVQHYPSYSYYGYDYGSYYSYPNARFGVSVGVGVRSSYDYAPGWSVRSGRGHVDYYPAYSTRSHSGGRGDHRGRR